ncbi:uncharacterized protein LOC128748768 isoform X2 [Synchiropus splendidus]|uniref:uncharacterized protein LOC128748768 isoform X2 n=1 Tax=Synchiropus splendidus TaxID=270530 RepID=UPI00237E7EEF|nr:uncharacterized protein LOC128748768 isoform X2 [Synchiropus splendidus]
MRVKRNKAPGGGDGHSRQKRQPLSNSKRHSMIVEYLFQSSEEEEDEREASVGTSQETQDHVVVDDDDDDVVPHSSTPKRALEQKNTIRKLCLEWCKPKVSMDEDGYSDLPSAQKTKRSTVMSKRKSTHYVPSGQDDTDDDDDDGLFITQKCGPKTSEGRPPLFREVLAQPRKKIQARKLNFPFLADWKRTSRHHQFSHQDTGVNLTVFSRDKLQLQAPYLEEKDIPPLSENEESSDEEIKIVRKSSFVMPRKAKANNSTARKAKSVDEGTNHGLDHDGCSNIKGRNCPLSSMKAAPSEAPERKDAVMNEDTSPLFEPAEVDEEDMDSEGNTDREKDEVVAGVEEHQLSTLCGPHLLPDIPPESKELDMSAGVCESAMGNKDPQLFVKGRNIITPEENENVDSNVGEEDDSGRSNTETCNRKKKKRRKRRNVHEEKILESAPVVDDDDDATLKKKKRKMTEVCTEELSSTSTILFSDDDNKIHKKKKKKKQELIDDIDDMDIVAEFTARKKRRKKSKSLPLPKFSEDEVTANEDDVTQMAQKKRKKSAPQCDDSLSTEERDKKRNSSFLVVDEEEDISALELPLSHVAPENQVSEFVGSAESTNGGVRKKKKKKKIKQCAEEREEVRNEIEFAEPVGAMESGTCEGPKKRREAEGTALPAVETVEASEGDGHMLVKKKHKKKKKLARKSQE